MMKLNTLYNMNRLDEFVKEKNLTALDTIRMFNNHVGNDYDAEYFLIEQEDDELTLITFEDFADFKDSYYVIHCDVEI